MTQSLSTAAAMLLLAVFPNSLCAQITQYEEHPNRALPDSLIESYDGDRFALTIQRSAADSFQAGLIRRAERLYPRPAVFDSLDGETLRAARDSTATRRRLDRAMDLGVGPRWWLFADGNHLVPFAVTDQAVRWYIETYRRRALDPVRVGRRGQVWPRGYVEYVATVHQRNERGTINYVVTLALQVGTLCEALCGGGFELTRVVTFDAEGAVLGLRGDGELLRWVS